MKARQAVVLASRQARNGKNAFEAIPRLLMERGVDVVDQELLANKRELCKAARRQIKRGARLVVICGGDGSLTSVVRYFAGKKCALGVVPAGTGNSFALGLGIQTLEEAADAIASGVERKVDLGVVNGKYFANFLTVGVAAEIGRQSNHALKKVAGAVAYGVAAVLPILTHEPFHAKLRWKRKKVRVDTHQIIATVGRFFGHQPLSESATPVDRRLTVFVREAGSRIDLIETYFALLRGEQRELSGVRLWSTPAVLTISTNPKAPVSADGIPLGKTPIRVCVEPKALRVMVPRAQDAALAS